MAQQLSKRAQADLDQIWDYVAEQSDSTATADRLIDTIIERFDLLGNYPEAGLARDDLGKGRRTFPVGNYVILYRVRGKDVLILRVAHSKRDLDTLFRT
jgi:plasmid stabilization system protein ParE